mmetsp:Transcript_31/g.59  ORF Transcript_31/g.59 Transcript_31/m.59 type:complete len:93 (+) Transcript_31:756-1034(+)
MSPFALMTDRVEGSRTLLSISTISITSVADLLMYATSLDSELDMVVASLLQGDEKLHRTVRGRGSLVSEVASFETRCQTQEQCSLFCMYDDV